MREASFQAIPSADRLLRAPEVQFLLSRFAREPIVRVVREILQAARDSVGAGETPPPFSILVDRVLQRANDDWQQSPRPLINATGVLLHTNLGRAPLSSDALAAVRDAAGYSDLEFDLRSGGRTSRHTHATRLLHALTDAGDAHVTVNAASAMTLVLATLARGKEVIVSRGQAVEIGGGFRIPTVLRQSGARLVEVGTTNRTRLQDYEDAITPKTAAILHVHASNFRIVGFTESVAIAALANLCFQRKLALVDDNGSGSFLDTQLFGLRHEPTPVESLAAGTDVVVFSGDKLLGGPQSGIILGRGEIIRSVARHPLARAVRPDKMTMAALNATLLAYIRGDAERTVPLWQMIGATVEVISRRADGWRTEAVAAGLHGDVVPGRSTVGGGSLPDETLPTTLLSLHPPVTARALRMGRIPVVARTSGNRVLLDPRTVADADDALLVDALRELGWRLATRSRDPSNGGGE